MDKVMDNNKITPDNQVTFDALKALGHDLPEIRNALCPLNKTNIAQVAKRTGIQKQTLYNVVNGKSKFLDAMRAYSKEFKLDPTKAFSDLLRFNT